jgi:hypothetical protein
MPYYNLAKDKQGMRDKSDKLFCNVPSEIKIPIVAVKYSRLN